MVPGYGADSDYEGIDVTGKIAVVQRGGTDENAEPNPSAGQMSTFTSIGATPDLRIKPELSAVGGNVSSIPHRRGQGRLRLHERHLHGQPPMWPVPAFW